LFYILNKTFWKYSKRIGVLQFENFNLLVTLFYIFLSLSLLTIKMTHMLYI